MTEYTSKALSRVLGDLPSTALMAMAVAFDDGRIEGGDDPLGPVAQMWEAVENELADRDEHRFCHRHLSVLTHPDGCAKCTDEDNGGLVLASSTEERASDTDALNHITALMDQRIWNANMCEEIAVAVRSTGRTIGDV